MASRGSLGRIIRYVVLACFLAMRGVFFWIETLMKCAVVVLETTDPGYGAVGAEGEGVTGGLICLYSEVIYSVNIH